MLHAARLILRHPMQTDRILDFTSRPPADMLAVLRTVWGEVWSGPVDRWLADTDTPADNPQ
jgi:hypothetical protein